MRRLSLAAFLAAPFAAQAQQPNMILASPLAQPATLTFSVSGGQIEIGPGGNVTLQGFKNLDAASRAFWEAVRRVAPEMCRSEGIR